MKFKEVVELLETKFTEKEQLVNNNKDLFNQCELIDKEIEAYKNLLKDFADEEMSTDHRNYKVSHYTSTTIDSKKLKEEMPETWQAYSRETNTIKVLIKELKKNEPLNKE